MSNNNEEESVKDQALKDQAGTKEPTGGFSAIAEFSLKRPITITMIFLSMITCRSKF